MVITKENCEFYNWGDNCNGWHFLKTQDLSIIEELMPPGTSEQLHFHKFATQLFYILKGTATFELDGAVITVTEGQGIKIKPFTKHRITNNTKNNLEFIVISQPTTRGDRLNEPFTKNDNFSLDGRKFRVVENTENGEVGSDTIFRYHQKGNIVWAIYEGGDVLFGTLSGRCTDNRLVFTYQHQNLQEEFVTGRCYSNINLLENGKIRLVESWQWTCKDFSGGTSILEEID